MAHAFTPDADGKTIIGVLDPIEIDLVLEALSETRHLLGAASTPAASELTEADLFAALSASMEEKQAPQDPVLRRLLPDGHAEDEDASAEFRRLTEDSVRRQKQEHLDAAIAVFKGVQAHVADDVSDVKVALSREQARATMMALTDVRLVLAEQLEIRTDEDAEVLHEQVERMQVPQSARDLTAMYYDFMTWLSETLTVAYLARVSG